ncbi:MAG: hypothetical protein ACI4I7_05865, partial [Oscillospiraceae bacterium]
MEYENRCQRCGKVYSSGSNRPGYCPECRKERQKERNREYLERKSEGRSRYIGSADVCHNCGKPYIVKTGSQILCDECIAKGVKLTKSKVNTKYRNKTYDSVTVYVSKGDREKLKEYANLHGFKSLNEFINSLIEYGMKNNFSIDDCVDKNTYDTYSDD